MKRTLKVILAAAAVLGIGAAAGGLLLRGEEGTDPSSLYELEVSVDFSSPAGEIKPLHGINNGPKFDYQDGQFCYDATAYFQKAGIPYVRTHDSEYPYGKDLFIDIHCVFPDMAADPALETSYHFEESDQYIEAIIDSGSQVFFRLGESIDHSGDNLYINPPADYEKWAQICEGIIRHYNEGFADGFHYGITYWEIWNEPDNSPMWTGTAQEYYELYAFCAGYLKERFPDLKIGGYGAAGTADRYMEEFLSYLSEAGAPLDFFSWHIYTANPYDYLASTADIRAMLEQYGYGDAELILDEWNYVAGWSEEALKDGYQVVSGVRGAAFAASSLIAMQNAGVDMAMYYDAQFLGLFCGLYEKAFLNSLKELPALQAFSYFNDLYEIGTAVRVSADPAENTYLLAAADGGERAVLVSSYGLEADTMARLTLNLENGYYSSVTIRQITPEHPLGKTTVQKGRGSSLTVDIPPDSVAQLWFY